MQRNSNQILPIKMGQIVRIFNPLPDEDPEREYIVAEDPSHLEGRDKTMLYPVSEIQRVSSLGGIPFSDRVEKNDLTVIGESLQEWIETWNKDGD